jgi:hypothetical protein
MAKILIIKRYTLKLVRENRNIYFVFGDNLIGKGKGGQAIIRDEFNTIGVPTKKLPSSFIKSYFTDDELKENKEVIDYAFKIITEKLKEGFYIALPEDGLGTGLSKLPEKAPLTYIYLEKKLDKLKEKYKIFNL